MMKLESMARGIRSYLPFLQPKEEAEIILQELIEGNRPSYQETPVEIPREIIETEETTPITERDIGKVEKSVDGIFDVMKGTQSGGEVTNPFLSRYRIFVAIGTVERIEKVPYTLHYPEKQITGLELTISNERGQTKVPFERELSFIGEDVLAGILKEKVGYISENSSTLTGCSELMHVIGYQRKLEVLSGKYAGQSFLTERN